MKPGWTRAPRDETPDPRLRTAQMIADLMEESPVAVVIGFQREPPNLQAEIDRLGGVELLTRVGSTRPLFKEGSRRRRFLFRLELAFRQFVRRRRARWVIGQ